MSDRDTQDDEETTPEPSNPRRPNFRGQAAPTNTSPPPMSVEKPKPPPPDKKE